ncbi:DNA double-strand break repair nuclease NurA [Lyngbya confervoides]|uniref:DNA double-strand break repair nuclease NurA n=1 Tax=Lyngbya confervoides BDU141951 TaxID=1574623 RepID=A0ABD4T2U9_9CYAN|nr:DNA double-strand break repair nuclease NurA [Lyngbya confervoides]MCM1982951.1 DNA double-strand break repair nuclease NurA [Lyngbya confervoides BDU141951]
MPLKPSDVLAILQEKQAEFTLFNRDASQELRRYRQAVAELSRQPMESLQSRLDPISCTGARPLERKERSPHWIIPTQLQWESREESLAWVRDQLTGVTTFSVDGSQIFPSKDLSLPVALVQIGWFENPHRGDASYCKDVRVNVVSPVELQQNASHRPADRQVNMVRFAMEVDRHVEFMEAHAHQSNCLTFVDGSLVASFAEVLDIECRRFYAQQCLKLLRASETYRVPLVGYIDTSNARDLVTMVAHLADLAEAQTLLDTQLFGNRMAWGDRTPLFLCNRQGAARTQGILSQYEEQAQNITFTYLKTHEGRPVRLELPRWIFEAGLLETVLNYVRSEVIIGRGYPYVIETADQVAVLRSQDRQLFFRLLQDWARAQDLDLRFSRKMISKAFRRR